MKQLKQILVRGHSPPKNHFQPLLTIKPQIIMKTIKLFFISVLFTVTVNSQITKTNWMVGGNANMNSGKTKYTSNNGSTTENSFKGVKIQPSIGYFLLDKFAVGITPFVAINSYDNSTETLYGIGPFARYYLLKPEKNINMLTHLGYTYNGNNRNSTITNEFIAKFGPVIYFNSSVGIEMTLDYYSNNTHSELTDSSNNGFAISFGFQIHLDK